jgi:lipoprotein-releasing system permease protein
MILIRSKISTLGKSFLVSPSQEEQIKEIDGIASSKIIEERVLFVFEDSTNYLKELIQISVK